MKLTQIKPNLRLYSDDTKRVYFSYETPIAFYDRFSDVWFLSKNIWTRTTGKHLNQIKLLHSNYDEVSHEVFTRYLETII